MTIDEKYIVDELARVLRKYRDVEAVRLAELLRIAFEREIGYTAGTKHEKRIHKSNT